MTSSAVLAIQPSCNKQAIPSVLTLAPFYPSTENPVSGCFIAEPLLHLEACGVSNTVFVAQPFYRAAATIQSEFPAEWVRFFSLPRGFGLSSAGSFLYRQLLSRVRGLARSRSVDLIHAHSALPCGHAAWLLGRTLGIPFVVTVHGLDASSRRQVGGVPGWLCERVSRQIYSEAQRVICVSEKVRHSVLQIAPRAKTSVIYNGVDCEYFTPRVSVSVAPIILAIGNLIPTKGHEILLRAFSGIRSEFPAARVQIVGEGPEMPRLHALAAELDISDSVEWLGRQSRSQVAQALRNCSVFALPSSYEGLGCVYLEAMASGKPVVGCIGQGIEEVIQHGVNGCLIEANHERDLAENLSQLLKDPALRHKIGSEARRTILNGFTLQHQAQRLLNAYEECQS
jgi:glycosyltransferase involved in cell wall biosynthesis